MEGIKRLEILSKDIKDRSLLKVIEYLMSRIDMNEKYLNEEKSLSQMVNFIKAQVKKEAGNEVNSGMVMIEDDIVYGWAIHYWDESNKDLDIDKAIDEIPKVIKPIKIETPKKEKIKKDSNKQYVSEGQISLFDVY